MDISQDNALQKRLHQIHVYGHIVDAHTRCVHYHSPLDIVALKCRTCGKFYPCYKCHNECEDHEFGRWHKDEFGEQAVLCGNCGKTLSINEYMAAEKCPHCNSSFNSGCASHYSIYFETSELCKNRN